MKLRNKKTDVIGDFCNGPDGVLTVSWQRDDGYWIRKSYSSIAAFNDEWEDYEEPETIFVISDVGSIVPIISIEDEDLAEISAIGNCFKTHEEAEKAIEKLKAWKRLKDKGFRITLHGCKGNAWLQANWATCKEIIQMSYCFSEMKNE